MKYLPYGPSLLKSDSNIQNLNLMAQFVGIGALPPQCTIQEGNQQVL